jgi:hypothetical protein
MPPAFDSPRQTAAFALLLAFLLAAPWLSAKKLLPQPRETYASKGFKWEPFPWLHKFIYEETNDIDIAFVGSSRMLYGVDTPYVQRYLDAHVGHKTVVRSICWTGGGLDSLYFITQDLLAHRHVKCLVFDDECMRDVHFLAPRWHRYGEDGGVMGNLPLTEQAIYYFAAVLKTSRDFPELLAPKLGRDIDSSNWEAVIDRAAVTNLGCNYVTQYIYDAKYGSTTNFAPYFPPTGVTPADLRIYAPAAPAGFVFSNQPPPAFQIYFARQFGLLAKNQGCQLALLYMPSYPERASPEMTEPFCWPDVLGTEVRMMGIPGSRLFAGLSDEEIGRLYIDTKHFNANGQEYFTSLITPALLQFYEKPQTH